MSSSALVWAWEQRIPPTSKLVLLALAEHASGATETVQLEEAMTSLVERTGLNVRTIQRHLKALADSHHVVAEERRDTHGVRLPNRWYLNVNELAPVPLDLWSAPQ